MVGIFTALIKLSRMNMTAQRMTDLLLPRFFSSENSNCPVCGAGNLRRYRKYSRWICEYRNGHVVTTRLKTERFICESCHTTHAFLVSLVIPYSSYSLITVLWAMFDYFSHRLTVKEICAKYEISVRTLYRWKSCFLRDKQLWLGILKDTETAALQFLKDLMNLPDFTIFEKQFMEITPDHRCFLQSHRNARFRQNR